MLKFSWHCMNSDPLRSARMSANRGKRAEVVQGGGNKSRIHEWFKNWQNEQISSSTAFVSSQMLRSISEDESRPPQPP